MDLMDTQPVNNIQTCIYHAEKKASETVSLSSKAPDNVNAFGASQCQ